MKVVAAAIVQAETNRISPDPGGASHHGHDGSFAQTFYRSICKGDSPPPASLPEAAQGAPSDETSVAMSSVENAAAALPSGHGVPARSVLPASAASATPEAEFAPCFPAGGASYARGPARPGAGGQKGAEPTAANVDHLAAAGSPTIAAQTTSRGQTWPAVGEETTPVDATSATDDPATVVLAAMTDGTRLARNFATPLAASEAEPATPFGGLTDGTPFLPQRASHTPVATAAATTTVPTATAGGARPARVFPIPLAASEPEPATPSGGFATDSPPQLPEPASHAPVPLTPFGGLTNDPPQLSPRASHAPLAATLPAATTDRVSPARVFATPTAVSAATSDGTRMAPSFTTPVAASEPEPATPFGGFAMDSTPYLPPPASHTPVAATLPATTACGARQARVFPIPLAASEPEPASPSGGFATDSPPQLPPPASHAPVPLTPFGGLTNDPPQLSPRASHAPLAATLPTSTTDKVNPARVFVTPTALPTATSDATRMAPSFATPVAASPPEPASPSGGFATDSPPHLPPPASHAHVLPTPFGGLTDNPAQLSPRASHAPLAATTLPTTAADRASPARVFAIPTAVPAARSDGTRMAPSSAAPAATSPPEPATLFRGFATDSPPHLPQPASHAPVPKPPQGVAGPLSRPARPAPASPPISSPNAAPTAPPAAEPGASVTRAGQALAEPRTRIEKASPEEPARAQDGTYGSSAEPSASLAAFIAVPNFTIPSSPHLRPGEMASVPEHVQAQRTGEGRATGEAHGASLTTPLAHGQDGLRAEAQATASLTQAPLQVTLPVHAPTASAPTSAPLGDPRGAAHLPAHAASLAAQVARDEGLSMTVLPHAAHMAIESPNGDLALHLRVRQGSAEITVGGSMAHLFETRAPEARAALASEGLALGRFDSGQQDGGQQNQPAPETPERAGEAPAPYRPNHGAPLPTPAEGRIHVTA
jgi:hypothetical protein